MDSSLTSSFTIPNFSHSAEQARHNDNSHPPSPRTSAEHNRPLSAHAHDNRSPTVGDAKHGGSSSDSPHSISPPPDHPRDKTAESSSTDERGLDNHRIIWDETDSPPKSKRSEHEANHHDEISLKRKIFHMRGYDDQDDTDWWFASTACPLLAATTAPLANVLSIAALVTYWRMNVSDGKGGTVPDFEGVPYRDPRWCYWINVASLIGGFVGNIFLLFNFTGRIRYIIALPTTIILWYMATFLLIADTVSLHLYSPPIGPDQIYSQGFWYAVISIVLYFISSSILLINMLGYFMGHYPQRFELNDHQRTLILQTMLFFIWLAGGGAMFSRVENLDNGGSATWAFVDGLYFCDVTILTLGFGDLVPHNDFGRGLVFPYSVGGIIMLGLVISSISKFASEMSEENVVRKHADKIRARTLERTTSDPMEIERLEILQNFQGAHVKPISAPFHARKMDNRSRQAGSVASVRSSQRRSSVIPAIHKRMNFREAIKIRNKKTKLLRHERDRFNEMRRIQMSTLAFKRWWALTVSVAAFAILWLVGAVIFWQTERPGQGWTYFDGLYFCYISLLTIGYGDFTPTSNAGRSFFVVWSLIAVPTMTLLISDMGSTVIESFKRGTFIAADFTVMLKKNVLADFINAHPRIKLWLIRRRQANAYRKRMREGLPVGTEDADTGTVDGAEVDEAAGTGIIRARSRRDSHAMNEQRDVEAREAGIRPSLDKLAREVQHDRAHPPPLAHMMRRLATAIRSVAQDLKLGGAERQYSFEEWAELTRLIRFTGEDFDQAVEREDEDVIEWDWLGEDSPMMTHASEPEFVLDRLCESLVRYTRKVERRVLWVKRELNKSRAADERMDSRQVMEEPDEESERTVGQLEQKQLENGD